MSNYLNITRTVTFALTLVAALLLPWNFIVPPVLVFLTTSWLLQPDWKEKWINFRSVPVAWLFLLLAAFYVAGYFWSENKPEAINSIVVKLAIFVAPLVFGSMRFNYTRTKLILQAFLAGLITVGIFMLSRSIYAYFGNSINNFSYQEFSRDIMHPSYLSLYYVVGIMICFHGILLRNAEVKKKVVAAGFTLFFCVMIFMLASKTGLISLVIVFLFYIIYAVVRFKRYVTAAIGAIALIAAFVIALNVFPSLKERITNLTQLISSDTPIDPSEVESNRVRILIWQQDMQLVSENLLYGTGTGDVQDELMKKYQKAGMTGAYEKKLNAHSQFFQTAIALGLPGLLVLCGIFLAAFTWCVRRRFGFCAMFTVLLVFNFIPESMLQIQAGTLFTGFFFVFVLFAADTAVLSPKS